MNAVTVSINERTYILSPLDIIRIVATRNGMEDVDLEPDVDGFKVTAAGKNSSVTVRGANLDELCEKFVTRMG